LANPEINLIVLGKSNIIVAHSMGTAVTMHTLLELKRLELISSVKKGTYQPDVTQQFNGYLQSYIIVVLIGARGLERPVSTFLLAYTPTFVLKVRSYPLVSNTNFERLTLTTII
jgi:pimeloyl-ACP methyl ester carboxylesterase